MRLLFAAFQHANSARHADRGYYHSAGQNVDVGNRME